MSNVIALIFDFDETLMPDSTSAFLEEYSIDTEKFWNEEVKSLVNKGFEPTHAFLSNFLKHADKGGKLQGISDDDMLKFGEKISNKFYKGFPEILQNLQNRIAQYPDLTLEFYIISGGLQKIIEGTSASKFFKAIYACELSFESGKQGYIKRVVTFTEKTRYIFEINKGILPKDTIKRPYYVNEFKAPEKRRVPLNNMIYVGDSRTDIPCFSLITSNGGHAFAVFDHNNVESAASKFKDFVAEKRSSVQKFPAVYTEDSFGATLKLTIQQLIGKIVTSDQNIY